MLTIYITYIICITSFFGPIFLPQLPVLPLNVLEDLLLGLRAGQVAHPVHHHIQPEVGVRWQARVEVLEGVGRQLLAH